MFFAGAILCPIRAGLAENRVVPPPNPAAAIADPLRQPPGGRWIGVIRYERPPGAPLSDGIEPIREHLAKLDLLTISHEGQIHEMIGMLNLHSGSFFGHEYLHFDYTLRFDEESKVLTFSSPNQVLVIETTHWDGRRIEAEVTLPPATDGFQDDLNAALKNDIKATLILGRESDPVLPQYPLIGELDGEYRGMCNQREQTVSISTSRTSMVGVIGADSFSLYQIFAQSGHPSKKMGVSASALGPLVLRTETGLETTCFDYTFQGIGRPCIYDSYNGIYNIYTGELQLTGSQEPLRCFRNARGLYCDRRGYKRGTKPVGDVPRCQLDRVDTEEDKQRGAWAHGRNKIPQAVLQTKNLFLPRSRPDWNRINPEPLKSGGWKKRGEGPGIKDGEYWGMIHHEDRDEYQSFVMRIKKLRYSTKIGTPAQDFLSISINLAFEGPPHMIIPYKYPDLPYDPKAQKEFVFQGADRFQDPIFQMTALSEDSVTGVWYSVFRGRVGTFHAYLNQKPNRPERVVTNPFGLYRSQNLQIRISPLRGFISNESNPFSLWAINFHSLSRRSAIRAGEGGSYDFYSNNIDVGHYLKGFRLDSGTMMLRHVVGTQGVGGIPYRRLSPFRLVERGGSPLNRGAVIIPLPPK
jgi:hypothetical protein